MMASRIVSLFRIVLLVLTVSTIGMPSLGQSGRVPCSEVLREIDAVVSRPGGAAADPVKVGRKLRVDPLWVERCAQVYGRRLSRSPNRSGLSKEEQDLAWESDEPEEFAPEEFEARDETYFHEIPNDRQDRSRLRRFKADSRNEWEPYIGSEWEPNTGQQWKPFLLDR